MLIGIGASIYSGNRYDAAITSANLAARFDAALGITSSGGFASAWADQSGNGRNLLQAAGANQPIHLPFVGTKYGYLPGVAGNYFSTPDSVAASIVGSIDIDVEAAMVDWTPAAIQTLLGKDTTAGNNRSYLIYVNTNGTLEFGYTNNGSSFVGRVATSSVAPTVANGAILWVRVTYNSTTGKVNFYTSADGESWTALGTEQTITSGAIYDGTGIVEIGSNGGTGTSNVLAGKIYRTRIYNGIRESGGTLAVDFDASRHAGGTTLSGSTGETWTINSTGSNPAQIVDRPSLLFDGAAHWMRSGAFTLDQPTTIYAALKPLSFTSGDRIIDGIGVNTGRINQNTATPQLDIYAGSTGVLFNGPAIGTLGIVTAKFNDASSSARYNLNSAVTGTAGASSMGGVTIGADGTASPATFANVQAYGLLVYSTLHNAATETNIIRALMSKWSVT